MPLIFLQWTPWNIKIYLNICVSLYHRCDKVVTILNVDHDYMFYFLTKFIANIFINTSISTFSDQKWSQTSNWHYSPTSSEFPCSFLWWHTTTLPPIQEHEDQNSKNVNFHPNFMLSGVLWIKCDAQNTKWFFHNLFTAYTINVKTFTQSVFIRVGVLFVLSVEG